MLFGDVDDADLINPWISVESVSSAFYIFWDAENADFQTLIITDLIIRKNPY